MVGVLIHLLGDAINSMAIDFYLFSNLNLTKQILPLSYLLSLSGGYIRLIDITPILRYLS
jgi:hypothetical protein